jgi:hypothetical protein
MFYENWTRKLVGFSLLVWAGVVLWRTIVLGESVGLTDLATSAGIIIAVAAAKSVGTDAVNKVKSANGAVTSEPVVTQNP